MRTRLLAALIVASGLVAPPHAQAPREAPLPAVGVLPGAKLDMSVHEAAAALDTWRTSLPDQLRGLSPGDLETRWPRWIRERDREIRARVAQGDEDSLVNLWLYG